MGRWWVDFDAKLNTTSHIFETDRLLIRNFNMKDLDDFHEYASNRKIGPMAGWKPHKNKYETKKILKNIIGEEYIWAIWHKKDSKCIGSIGIHRDERRDLDRSKCKCIGYVLSEDYWGQGLMPEACQEIIRFCFSNLKLELLTVYHFDFNKQSKRVIEKLHFQFEGVLKKASRDYKDDIYDTYCYSMTREDFKENYEEEWEEG